MNFELENDTMTLRRGVWRLDERLMMMTEYGIGGGADALGCPYNVMPLNPPVGPANGQHRVWVATVAGCPWSAQSGGWVHATLTVRQSGVCDPMVQPVERTVGGAAGESYVDVTTGADCVWTAASNASFLHVAAYEHRGPERLVFTHAANPSDSARVGTLTVGGVTVTVMQLAASDPAGAFDPRRDAVRFYHTDAIGSVRTITDMGGQVVERLDYWPFGEPWPASASSTETRRFAGKESDRQTGLDYFGARYYASQTGRFTTVDPVGINPLWLVNPQRMSRYTYGLNNPFTYIDPDGRDAIVVNFSTGAPISGYQFGHNGIISVHRAGSATFADFGSINQGVAESPGIVNTLTLPRIAFGANGVPPRPSFMEISAALAKASGRPADSIRLAYFKTSEVDTAQLDAWIQYTYNKSRSRKGLTYNVFDQNCGHYCLTGLRIAQGRGAPPAGGFSFSNFDFWILEWLADTTYEMKATVTTSETYCVVGQDCR